MKRSFSALFLCTSLLAILASVMLPRVGAKENPIATLLNQPGPPPPNPLARAKERDAKFYNKSKPPADDAPIEDLLDYWTSQNVEDRGASYNPKPSDAVAERLIDEIRKRPEKLPDLMNALPEGKRTAALVKELYDREGKDGVYDQSQRQAVRRWLTYNTDQYTNDLERLAANADNQNEYITNHEELLALAKVDFDRAKPIVERLESAGADKPSSVLAKWARYRNALASNSSGDVDTYRNQLKAVVADKKASAGMRDLALDALAREKDWEGRDDWYLSLFGDETLLDLKVNGQTFTGLTTMMNISPEEKFIDRMLELLKSDVKSIRSAAARNLSLRMNERPHVVRALVPMLEDPDWVTDVSSMRGSLIYALAEVEAPESVPGLIKVLDEKSSAPGLHANTSSAANAGRPSVAANAAANTAANGVSAAAVAMANAAVDRAIYRSAAVGALAKQKDPRAVPALRRILPEGEQYERQAIVTALLACNGFTLQEQLDGLETAARGVRGEMDAEEAGSTASAANVAATAANSLGDYTGDYASILAGLVSRRTVTPAEIRKLIGEALLGAPEISDDLAGAIVARIEQIETKDPRTAAAYRRIVLKWKNPAINTFLLRDVGRGVATADAMIRLIGQRKQLQEGHSAELTDLRSGKGVGLGLGTCLTGDEHGYPALLEKPDIDAKAAMLACARLVRASIPVEKVVPELKSTNELLKLAAERYLESEDSQEARGAVLAIHPGEIKVMGARSAFSGSGSTESASEHLWAIFTSLGNDSIYNGWYGASDDEDLTKIETTLRSEIKENTEIVALYSYDRHYIRVYKDRAIFSWDEDDSRYRERPLSKREFEGFTDYLESNDANRLPPFLSCGGEYCSSKELLMFDRKGGRRVYVTGSELEPGRGQYAFFNGLDRLFIELKRAPATLRYAMSRDFTGLEIIFAADGFHADTVWSGTGELRVVGSLTAVRKEVDSAIEEVGEEDLVDTAYEENEKKRSKIRKKRRFEGFGWYRLAPGGLEPNAAQPAGVEYIAARDEHAAQPIQTTWKARTTALELRANATGLYKLAGGKMTRIRAGSYRDVVVSPDGRWAVATKTEDEAPQLVRIDLRLGKEFAVTQEAYPQRHAAVYVPALGRFLLVPEDNTDEHGYYDGSGELSDEVPYDADPESMLLIDPATGISHSVKGEFRPLAQQTFRPLQPTAKPNEFWAAIPDVEKNETTVGIYNARTFTFTQVLRVPKIKFNSMTMWADEPAAKLYFTYRGHVLALPLKR